MQKFGYLQKTNPETGNFIDQEHFDDAVKNFQTFANLPVTGKSQRLQDENGMLIEAVKAFQRFAGLIETGKISKSRWRCLDLPVHVNTSFFAIQAFATGIMLWKEQGKDLRNSNKGFRRSKSVSPRAGSISFEDFGYFLLETVQKFDPSQRKKQIAARRKGYYGNHRPARLWLVATQLTCDVLVRKSP